MNKKISLGTTITAALLAAVLALCGGVVLTQNRMNAVLSSERQQLSDKVAEIDDIVRKNFYKPLDEKSLLDGLARGYIGALDDRYGSYMTQEAYSATELHNDGKGVGIGITVLQHPDDRLPYITSVVAGAPADRAGLQAGDRITAVAGTPTTADNYSDSISSIQGEINTPVVLTIRRGEETFDREVIRGQYDTPSVSARMLSGDIGYIKITAFNRATHEQVKAALQSLQGTAKGLLFDVRGNPGGLVDATAAILDDLLPAGTLVSATYRNGRNEVLHTSDDKRVDLPMAVLINGDSASASELFAAAVRDLSKGALIGEKSFGKGIMQRTYVLKDKSAVKITVAEFNPPSGTNFHGIGLVPDVEVAFTPEQAKYHFMLTDATDPFIVAGVNYLKSK